MSLTRRSLLGVAAGLAVAGCRPHRRRPTTAPNPDAGVLTAAVTAEEALLADYDRAIAASDAVAAGRLTFARDRHATHLRALRAAVTGSSPSTAPTPGSGSGAPLTTSLRSSTATLRTAAVGARDGRTAALLASVAAEHSADVITAAQVEPR